jgi:hypothetical protein
VRGRPQPLAGTARARAEPDRPLHTCRRRRHPVAPALGRRPARTRRADWRFRCRCCTGKPCLPREVPVPGGGPRRDGPGTRELDRR